MKTRLLFLSIITVMMSCARSQTKNPSSICKECGSFDLSKIDFTEKMDVLASKTEIFKTALVNQNNQEKDAEELSKDDQVKFYKYNFANQREQILGEKPFNYNKKFHFTDLTILTTPNKKMLAYEATVFYEGDTKKIDAFIADLADQHKSIKMTQNEMEGNLTVYQWQSPEKIVQVVRSNEPNKEEITINGKTTVRSISYVKLNRYDANFISNSVREAVRKDLNFAVFDERNFKSH